MTDSETTPPTGPEIRVIDPLLEIDLDPYNPRLRLEDEGSDQIRLMEIMVERFNVNEIAESIVSAGFLPVDPMVAYEHNGRVIIREGNRRLAAIKLLLNPDLAPESSRPLWVTLAERVSPEDRTRMASIQVTVYQNRNDPALQSYIGFRHVTGVMQWPALEKAGFIAELTDSGWSYSEIAARLGSYPAHVRRHYVAYKVVRQTVGADIPGHQSMQSSFGVLLRALQAAGIADFLGLSFPDDPQDSQTPIPGDRLDRLEEFVRWTFGTDDIERVLPDSRQLTKWGKIFQSAEALRYLRSVPDPTFDRAWFKSGGQAESLADALWSASYRLEESVPLIFEHRNNEEVREAARQCALFVAQILQHLPELQSEFGIGLTDDRPTDDQPR